MTSRVTMRDVAREANVSPMTVSRALRGDEAVNASTRQKIQTVASRLGYVYDSTAQAFRTKKSGFVAVTLPSINNANFAETFHGLSDSLRDIGLQVLLGSTNYCSEKEEDLIQQLLARNPEAIVLTGGHHTEATRKLLKGASIPIVEIWDLPTEPLGHVVGFSNARVMGKIVQHLYDKGHRKLAFVGAENGSDLRGAARRQGVISMAKSLGLPEVKTINAGVAPVSMRHGSVAISRIGKAIAEYDALICVSDPVAFGALSECKRLGINVPNELAITGFGNFEVATTSSPRITTAGVNAKEIGTRVAALLGEHFAGRLETPQIIDLGSRLIAGETS